MIHEEWGDEWDGYSVGAVAHCRDPQRTLIGASLVMVRTLPEAIGWGLALRILFDGVQHALDRTAIHHHGLDVSTIEWYCDMWRTPPPEDEEEGERAARLA